MDENPNGHGERHDGHGVADEVDGSGVLAVIRGRIERAERRARPVVAVVGPRPVRLAHARRVLCRYHRSRNTKTY